VRHYHVRRRVDGGVGDAEWIAGVALQQPKPVLEVLDTRGRGAGEFIAQLVTQQHVDLPVSGWRSFCRHRHSGRMPAPPELLTGAPPLRRNRWMRFRT
jgi:hypothetical protein